MRCFLIFALSLYCLDASAVDVAGIQRDAVKTLVDLIRLDTTQPRGNEDRVANYLKVRLDKAGIESRIYAAVPGRSNIVARIKGNGSARPILLIAHTDVVAVERTHWSVPPFKGAIQDGRIYGRGATDDKSIAAANLEILLALHRYRVRLDRDVIFLAVADEESGGELGVSYMVHNHFDAIDAEFAINEGGRGYIDPSTGEYVNFQIGTAEKTPRRARLIAHGQAGHGSVPTRDNPIGVLARAVARLFDTPMPMRLDQTTRTFFSRLAKASPKSEADIYRAILQPTPGDDVQEQLRRINPSYDAIIRTTISPTIIKGGYPRNVIPSEAEATLDIRALPGTDPDEMFSRIRRIIDDPSIEIVPMAVTRPDHQPASLDTEMFHAFESVLVRDHPGALVLPVMLTGATDSAQLRASGIAAYGFGPGVVIGEANGVHGNDEYVRVDAFKEYVRLMWDIVNQVCSPER